MKVMFNFVKRNSFGSRASGALVLAGSVFSLQSAAAEAVDAPAESVSAAGSVPTAAGASGVTVATAVADDDGDADDVSSVAKPSDATADGADPVTKSKADEVRVNGSKLARASGSVTVIKEKQLKRFKHDDVHAVLAQAPGVYTRGEDGVGLRPNIGLRGVNPDRSKKVTLLEDGVLVAPAPYSAPAAYYFPLMSRISGMWIVKGSAAIAEGPQTIAGALDLTTRAIPGLATGELELTAGQFGFERLHGWFGSSDDKTGFLIEGAQLGSSGFKELPSGADTGFSRNEWMLKAAHELENRDGRRQELRFKGVYSDETSNETYLGLTDSDFRANPNQRYGVSGLDQMRNHRTALALTHELTFGSALSLSTTAYRSDLARVWRKVNGFRGAELFSVLGDPTRGRNAVFASLLRGEGESSSSDEALLVGPNERTYYAQGLQSRLRWTLDTGEVNHRIEAGLRVHQDGITRRHSQDAFRIVNGDLVPEGSPTVTTAFNDASTGALAAHVFDAITWDLLTITPGLRVEAFRQTFTDRLPSGTSASNSDAVLLPGIGVFAGLTKNLGVLAGVHRGFSPPAPGGGSSTRSELSTNYEGGLRWVRGHERLEAIAFYNDYQNITDICTLSSGCVDANLDRQFDGGRARIYGLEASGEHDVELGVLRMPIIASYTYTRSAFSTSFVSEDPSFGTVTRGDELPYLPRHQGSVTVGLEGKEGGIAAIGNYVAAMREAAGSAAVSSVLHTDTQYWLDVSGRVRLTDHVTLQLNGRNVLGDQFIVSHRPFGARPNAPRWLQAGLTVTF
jgi:Fe(3+) dicitrate transport protein